MKSILIYHDGGETCLHDREETRQQLIKQAASCGHIGYLSGFRYWNNGTQPVMCFFKEKPTQKEVLRRRENGFKAATWHYINRKIQEAAK